MSALPAQAEKCIFCLRNLLFPKLSLIRWTHVLFSSLFSLIKQFGYRPPQKTQLLLYINFRKTLDFTTFSDKTDFITLCTPLSKMQKITFFPSRLTHSFRVKIVVHHSSPTAFRIKMMLSDPTICLSKTLIFTAIWRYFTPRGHDFSCRFKPLILQGRHFAFPNIHYWSDLPN